MILGQRPAQTVLLAMFICFIVVLVGLVWWSFSLASKTRHANANISIACTLEAKLCPDGSYVGRSGPTCEFAACPPVNTNAQ